jgi:Ca2+-binding EF-hand superfamily protein
MCKSMFHKVFTVFAVAAVAGLVGTIVWTIVDDGKAVEDAHHEEHGAHGEVINEADGLITHEEPTDHEETAAHGDEAHGHDHGHAEEAHGPRCQDFPAPSDLFCKNAMLDEQAHCAADPCTADDFGAHGHCCVHAGHHSVDQQLDRDVALGIVTVLIIFGVIFEQGILGSLKRAAKGGLEPIVDALMSEVCMLGVIAMLLFVFAHKVDWLKDLSKHIFGDDEHLIHSLENVHFTMFFVMMTLLVEAIGLVIFAHHKCRQWGATNEQCLEDEEAIISAYAKAEKSKCSRVCGSSAHDAMKFLVLRKRFVSSHDKSLKIPENFEFNDYISAIAGETIGECVEIPLFSWFMVWLVVVAMWALMRDLVYIENFAVAYVLIGFVFSLMVIMVYNHLQTVQTALMSQTLYRKAKSAAGAKQLGVAAGEASPLAADGPAASYEKLEETSDEPAYCTDPRFSPKRSCLARLLCCACCREEEPQSRHTALFWFGEAGPEFILAMIRLSLVFCALYIGYFVAGLNNKLWSGLNTDENTGVVHGEVHYTDHSDPHGPIYNENPHCVKNCDGVAEQLFQDKWQVILVVIAACMPVLTLFAYLPKTIEGLVFATSVEMMKRRAVVAEVRREMGTKKAIRAMKLLRMMKASSKARNKDASRQKPDIEPSKLERMRAEVKEMFDMFDTDQSGQVDADELFDLLKMMNIEDTKEGANLVLKEIDVDNSMCVDFEEFFEWYASTMAGEGEGVDDVDAYVKDMFDMLRTGEEQVVTKESFFAAMKKIGGGLTDDDIAGIMTEIDKDRDNTIDEEELREFIKEHMENF